MTGVRDWYDPAPPEPDAPTLDLRWSRILESFRSVELDMQDWGIDLESGILKERSWRWFETRIYGLIAREDSRLHQRLRIRHDT